MSGHVAVPLVRYELGTVELGTCSVAQATILPVLPPLGALIAVRMAGPAGRAHRAGPGLARIDTAVLQPAGAERIGLTHRLCRGRGQRAFVGAGLIA